MALREMLKQFLDAKIRKETAETEMDELRPELLLVFSNHISRGNEPKVDLKTEDWEGHATYVAPTTLTEVDAARLQELVDADTWAMITVTAVDSKKLQAAVELGKINQATMKECTVEKPRAGYVRFNGHPVDRVIEQEVTPVKGKTTSRKLVRPASR